MTETTQEEIERLNPQFKWSWRKTKRVIKRRAKSLIPNVSYAWGCRGHPGLVIKRNYWPGWGHRDLYSADVVIKSLIDGVEESCSIFHCAPKAMSAEEAFQRAEEIRTIHSFDLSIMRGYPPEKIRKWWNDWVSKGSIWYVLHDQSGYTVCSHQVFTKEDAEKEIESLQSDWVLERGEITNPRMVDMRTYPAPPTLFPTDDVKYLDQREKLGEGKVVDRKAP